MDPHTYLRNIANAVAQTWQLIDQRRHDPDALTLVELPHKAAGSHTYQLDLEAEQALHEAVHDCLGTQIACTGEEFPAPVEVLQQSEFFAACDALDGSTLLRLGLNHWAVALAIVANGADAGIHAAAVADSAGRVVCAHRALDGVYDRDGNRLTVCLSGQRSLQGATLSFSGATPKKSLAMQARLGARFRDFGLVIPFAGSPGILKVLSGQVDCATSISRGYDFAAAAFLAERAGAYVRGLNGEQLPYRDALLDSTRRHPWIVATTKELGEALRAELHGK